MKTPYVPHLFGADALAKAADQNGWLTVGVASSIAWPIDDTWVQYDGSEYLLHGVRQEGERRIAPSVSTPATRDEIDDALSRLYRFVSVLGFFKRGYVDITSRNWSAHIMRNVTMGEPLSTLLQGGERGFSCNHMPVIENDQVRKALAFLREGRRLERVHEPYSFLSFFKVIESQFRPRDRVAWVEENLALVTLERAVNRINELRERGVNVNQHLFDSGRCAVAHASVDGNIVDPDVPADRKRIAADLDIISALADRYIKIDAGVPDEMDLYKSRDRVAPWYALMPTESVATLKAGGHLVSEEDLGQLNGATVSVRLWPDAPAPQFEKMTLLPMESANGAVKFIALSARGTIVLAFAMDVANGRMHTLLNEGGMRAGIEIGEEDIEDYTRYFHSVVGNRIVELTIDGAEPVDCEVVIPVNIIPQAPEDAVAHALNQFRRSRQQDV
ncbi:methylamine utilization protein MauJ [Burkholderia sp. BCC1970]|uniref:methylamine utilization protein MauJ n=1 Tax=Burkholderia sp. BCC1970 TaxID=2817437 RepID=UPI002ABD4D84|nr:methylamine utilization protein MauJ [Burkholderia sp. BCC1970]